MSALNNVIQDTDNDIGRLRLGKDISRARKKAHLRNDDLRRTYKEKLRSGLLDSLEFIHKISHTIGKIHDKVSLQEDISNESEGEDVEIAEKACVVCFLQRVTTWIFMPCRHANFCGDCSDRLRGLEQTCPICRTQIEDSFQIFTS